MKAYICKHGTSWRWVVNIRPWLLYPPGKNPGTRWIGGWGIPRTGLDILDIRKCLATSIIQTPDHPAPLHGWWYIFISIEEWPAVSAHSLLSFSGRPACGRLSLCVAGMYLWVSPHVFFCPFLFLSLFKCMLVIVCVKWLWGTFWLHLCRVYVFQGHRATPDPVPVCGAEFSLPCPLLGQFILCWDGQQTGSANGHYSWPDTWHIRAGTWRNTCSYYWWCCT